MNFISEDKKTINLPVPLGSTVYMLQTTCNDACTFQKKKFDKIFPPREVGRCGFEMPCHTILRPARPIVVSLDNLGTILQTWGINTFETEDEARKAGEILTQEHKQKLLELGLKVTTKENKKSNACFSSCLCTDCKSWHKDTCPKGINYCESCQTNFPEIKCEKFDDADF